MNRVLKIGVMLSVVLLLATNVWAFPIDAGDYVTMNSSWGDNYGMRTSDGIDYNTFCLEADIYFNNNTTYFVESVGAVAVSGGINDGEKVEIDSLSIDGDAFIAKGDPVSAKTIWLYAAYFDGVFDDEGLGTGQTLVKKVQNAIWYEEDELDSDSVKDDYDDLIEFYSSDYDLTGWDIRVVNIVGGPDKDHQSQLVGAPVPEPATMILFGMGLLGLAGVSRKTTNKA